MTTRDAGDGQGRPNGARFTVGHRARRRGEVVVVVGVVRCGPVTLCEWRPEGQSDGPVRLCPERFLERLDDAPPEAADESPVGTA